ncbi:RB1-inducible coiled-coil protein 1 isoform X1, partial [Vespula squamosa]
SLILHSLVPAQIQTVLAAVRVACLFKGSTCATLISQLGLLTLTVPVAQLKEAIERECGVVAVHQVLLMSGGESLEPNARVCSYSAGTDTNPIYLFSKAAIESNLPPTPSIDYGSGLFDHRQDRVLEILALGRIIPTKVCNLLDFAKS